jgi:hypothetical protein
MLAGNPATKCAGVNDLQINWMKIIRLALTALLASAAIINALELQTPKVARIPRRKTVLSRRIASAGNPGLLSSEHENQKFDRKIHDACFQQLPGGDS